MAQCQGVPRLNGGPKSFFVSPILTGNCSENPQSARDPAQCKSSLGKNMISYRQYLNSRGNAGDASPHQELASPHRDLASPN